jgi:hypothetical protein
MPKPPTQTGQPIFHQVEYGSDDYWRLKIGMPTASGFANVVTPKGAPTTGDRRKRYMYRLIAERLMRTSLEDQFETYWTRRGKQLEPKAADEFAEENQCTLAPGGFYTTANKKIGCSPDRLIMVKGGNCREALEIKCPKPETHIGYLLDGPGDAYRPQVQGELLVTGFDAMHLFSYHPQMPPFHVVTLRDEVFIAKLKTELYTFCCELDDETARAKKLGPYTLSETLKQVLSGGEPGAWESEL